MKLLLQNLMVQQEGKAYEIGYEIGYFIGDNLFIILGISFLIVLLVGYAIRKRKRRI